MPRQQKGFDWTLFGKRVHAGVRVRGIGPDRTVWWQGILLENYPYGQEEFFADIQSCYYARRIQLQNRQRPRLRFQPIDELGESYFLLMGRSSVTIEFRIKGKWRSLTQIMA